jgi:RimJ/RimL family protein N-acetyltransferase
MTTDDVRLRPVAENDFAVLDRFLLDPEAMGEFQLFGWRDPGRWRRTWREDGMLGEDVPTLIVEVAGEPVGIVAWRPVRTSGGAHYWNIGIGLLPEARGRGLGTTAHRQLTEYLFAHTPVERVEATTEVGNVAEQRALEKIGFVREGVLRSHHFRAGRYRDLAVYGVLRAGFA